MRNSRLVSLVALLIALASAPAVHAAPLLKFDLTVDSTSSSGRTTALSLYRALTPKESRSASRIVKAIATEYFKALAHDTLTIDSSKVTLDLRDVSIRECGSLCPDIAASVTLAAAKKDKEDKGGSGDDGSSSGNGNGNGAGQGGGSDQGNGGSSSGGTGGSNAGGNGGSSAGGGSNNGGNPPTGGTNGWPAPPPPPPVPEPATIVTIGAGLAIAGLRRWARNR